MSLNFTGGSNNDEVDFGSAAALDDAVPFTKYWWCRASALLINDRLFNKSTSADFSVAIDGSNNDLRIRSSGGDVVRTDDAPLSTNTWMFIAATYDSGAAQFGHIYVGTLTTLATESTYNRNNNNSWSGDSGNDYTVGNRSSGGLRWQGDIAIYGDIDRALSLGEIQSLQFRPRVVSGQRIFCHFGFNGTGTQPDWSGNGHDGTVTSATVADHVPLGPPFGFDAGWVGQAGGAAPSVEITTSLEGAIQATVTPNANLSAGIARRLTQTMGMTGRLLDVQIARPSADITLGGWAPELAGSPSFAGSPSELYPMIDEAVTDDIDFIQSSGRPSNDLCEVRLQTLTDPSSSDDHEIRYRYQKDIAGAAIDLEVKLMDGGTTIATWNHTNISTEIVEARQTLSGAQADNITDYGNLRLRFGANQV